jgi:hypothetical protein
MTTTRRGYWILIQLAAIAGGIVGGLRLFDLITR